MFELTLNLLTTFNGRSSLEKKQTKQNKKVYTKVGANSKPPDNNTEWQKSSVKKIHTKVETNSKPTDSNIKWKKIECEKDWYQGWN